MAASYSNRAAGYSAWGQNQALARRTSRLQHTLVSTAGLSPDQVDALRRHCGVSRLEDIARVTSAELEALQIPKSIHAIAQAAITPASTPVPTPETHVARASDAAARALLRENAARRRLPRREFPRRSARLPAPPPPSPQPPCQAQAEALVPAKQRDLSATTSPVSSRSDSASPVTLPGGSGSDRSVSDSAVSDRSCSDRS